MCLRPLFTRFRSGDRLVLIVALTCHMMMLTGVKVAIADATNTPLTIEAIGTSPINKEDPSSAEQSAINDALMLAVDKGVATVVPADILADNFEDIITTFYGSAEQFILNYKKLAMAKVDGFCRVMVRASIPADNIKERIRQIGILIDRESTPRVLIMINEESAGHPPIYWWREGGSNVMITAEKAMAQDFTRRGITPVPHDRRLAVIESDAYGPRPGDDAAFEIGRRLGVDFVITGSSSVIVADDSTSEATADTLGALDVRLLDINTASVISMTTAHSHADVAEPVSDTVSALSAAGREAARRFAPAIIAAFEQQRNRTRVIQIRVQGVGYLAHLNTFRNLLESTGGIKRPQINEMKIDEAVISVDFSGTPVDLAETLMSIPADGLNITVRHVSEAGVVIELTAADKTADFNETNKTFRP